MIDTPHPFTGVNIRIPIIIPTEGKGFINQGLTLGELLNTTALESLNLQIPLAVS